MTRFGENPGAFSHQRFLPTSKPQKSWRRHPESAVPGSAHAEVRSPGAQLGAAGARVAGPEPGRAGRAGGQTGRPGPAGTDSARPPRGVRAAGGDRGPEPERRRDRQEENAGWARPGPRVTSGQVGRARKREGRGSEETERGGERRAAAGGGGARPGARVVVGAGPRGSSGQQGRRAAAAGRPGAPTPA